MMENMDKKITEWIFVFTGNRQNANGELNAEDIKEVQKAQSWKSNVIQFPNSDQSTSNSQESQASNGKTYGLNNGHFTSDKKAA